MLNKELLLVQGKKTYTFTLTNKSSEVLKVKYFWDPQTNWYGIKTNPDTAVLNPGDTVVFELLNMDELIDRQNVNNAYKHGFTVRLQDIIIVIRATAPGCVVNTGGGGITILWPKSDGAKNIVATITYLDWD